jgi:hypothetical protein
MGHYHRAFRTKAPTNVQSNDGVLGLMKVMPARAAIVAKKSAVNRKLPSPRRIGPWRIDFAFRFMFGQDVQGDLLAFGSG